MNDHLMLAGPDPDDLPARLTDLTRLIVQVAEEFDAQQAAYGVAPDYNVASSRALEGVEIDLSLTGLVSAYLLLHGVQEPAPYPLFDDASRKLRQQVIEHCRNLSPCT